MQHNALTEEEFKNEFGRTFCKIRHKTAHPVIVLEWHGYTTKEQVLAVTYWAERLMNKNPYSTIINDCTSIISVWEESVIWFAHVWILKMKHKGLKCLLHVSREDSFGSSIGKKLQHELTGILPMHTFKNMTDCEDWLKQQLQPRASL